MMRNIPISRVTTQPTFEPVTVEQVKANAYIVSDTSYDDLISSQFIPAARRYVEQITERSLVTQTRKQYHDCLSPEITVRYGPLQSVTSVTYKDSAGDTQTLTSSLYTVDTASIPGRIVEAYNRSYPSSITDTNSVVITAICGYGSTIASVPIIYRRAIILLCTHWHLNRDTVACGEVSSDMATTLQNMLAIEGATVTYA